MVYKVGSLFAGIGGICKGFKNAGFTISWANEIDKHACKTYSLNFDHKLINKDINLLCKADIEDVDILTSGFPCQAFSIAGKQKGFNDERGNLFFETMRIAKLTNPKIIVLENVKNLISHDKGNTINVIKNEIEKSGYSYDAFVLNTSEYGNLPQNRERIYIVCVNKKSDIYNKYIMLNNKDFFKPSKIKLDKTIHSIKENIKIDETYYYRNTKYDDMIKECITDTNTVYQLRRVYIRENKNNLCPTLTANMGTGGHNVPIILDKYGVRKFTPRECLRLQGFDDDYSIPENMANCHIYKQVGNSVSVPVIESIAKRIMLLLNS